MHSVRSTLLAGVAMTSGLVMGVPGAATAQDAVGGAVEEVVVTAQRREQRLQDVPAAVSVVSGQALERGGLRNLEELGARLPTVKIVQGAGADLVNIRGVGSGGNTGFEQAVATFVDGVYRGRARSIRASLFDVDRIEVLKGPQSTFFGNNAIAGALNITTRKPGTTFGYNLTALTAPSDGEYAIEGGVTAPLSDKLSIRLAGKLYGQDGYIYNSITNADGPHVRESVGRFSIRWEPSENFRSDFRIDAGQSNTQGAFNNELLKCPPDPAYGAARGPCAAYLAASGGVIDAQLNYRSALPDTYYDYRFQEAAWTNSLQLGSHSLTSITSYFHHDADLLVQLIPIPLPGIGGGGNMPSSAVEDYRQISQEVRLQSASGGFFEYMVGGYYSQGHLGLGGLTGFYFNPFGSFVPQFYNAGSPIAGLIDMTQRDSTKSAFASATIRPVQRVRVNLGLRYSVVDKTAHRANVLGVAGPIPYIENFVPGSPAAQTAVRNILGGNANDFAQPSRTDKKLMPSVGVQYDVSEQVMAYVSYTRGFKAGGYGSSAIGDVFGPETVDAYEAGLKSTLFDRRLTLNLAVFQSDYKGLQESANIFLPSGSIQTAIRNAAGARSKGVELGGTLRITEAVAFTGDVALLDAKYTSYPNGSCTIFGTLTAGCVQNLSGKRRPYAPTFSGNAGFNVTLPLAGFELRLDPSLYFTSRFYQSGTIDPLIVQPGYVKFDARIGFGPADRRWEVALIGKNLTDKLTASGRGPVSAAGGTISASPDRPRSVAIQVSLRN